MPEVEFCICFWLTGEKFIKAGPVRGLLPSVLTFPLAQPASLSASPPSLESGSTWAAQGGQLQMVSRQHSGSLWSGPCMLEPDRCESKLPRISLLFKLKKIFLYWGVSQVVLVEKLAANVGAVRDAGLGRSSGGGHGNTIQYSCLENAMDGGAWWAYSPWGHKELDTTEAI